MTWILPEDPDAEALTCKYLAAAGIPTSTDLPATYTAHITVQRIGDGASSRFYDSARLQIAGWGTDKATARKITARALNALLSWPGAQPPPDVDILDVERDSGMSWQPDDSTIPLRPRYIAGVVVTLNAIP